MTKTSLVLFIITIIILGSSFLNAATYTVINTNDTGAGSLRQAILDANSNTGADIIDFSIPLADPNYSNWTGTTDFWWKITLATNLPDIAEDLAIDGLSQSTNISDSNVGVVGTGGTVGVDAIILPQYEKLEIEIDANDLSEPIRIAVGTDNVLLEAICIFNSAGDAILARGDSQGNEIRKCFVGSRADGSEPGAGLKNDTAGIRIHYSAGMLQNIATIYECYLAYNGNSGVIGSRNDEATPTFPYIGATIIVEYCEAFENGWNSDSQDGIDGNGANNIIRYNLAYNNRSLPTAGAGSGAGIEVGGYSDVGSNTDNTIFNNTCYGNDNHGIVLLRRPTSDVISKNIIRDNNGPGILVTNRHYYDVGLDVHTYTRYNQITQNSIYDNAGLGIDLCNVEWDNYINGDEVTFNNGTYDADLIHANEDIDFPVITDAILEGNSLTLEGYVGSAADQALFANCTVEFYISSFDGIINPNPIVSNDSYPYHGEGKTYLGSLTTDADGNFSGNLDVTGFGVTLSTWLTSTATDVSSNTSEFGVNMQADPPLPVTLTSFTAIQTAENLAQINWTTQSESGLLGYNIYRNDEENHNNSIILNPTLIIPTNSPYSHDYSYIDTEVEFEQTYYYWLESIELDGDNELFGPVSIFIENPDVIDFSTTVNSDEPKFN